MTEHVKIPELLAPAGSLEKLKIAVHYGADAVYLGCGQYSLRAHAGLSHEELAPAVAYAHEHGVKVYVTVNIMAHNRDVAEMDDYLAFLAAQGVDGLIISDPGVVRLARQVVPELPIHLSTQANVTNVMAAQFWQEQGVERLNLARELSLSEIIDIRDQVDLALEVFVHGALCISYSGRCSLSLYMTGRDANLGNCAHPCRYNYVLEEEKRPGQYFPVEEDSRGTYIFNSKDLCLLHRLPALVGARVHSLKIEGRMKSIYYVGATVRLYRAALDVIGLVLKNHGPASLYDLQWPEIFSQELLKIGSRGYTENFINGPPEKSDMLYDGIRIQQTHAPVGVVRKASPQPLIEARNPLEPGDLVEYLGQGLAQWSVEIKEILDQEGQPMAKASPGNLVTLRTMPELDVWRENGLLRYVNKQ